MTLLALLRHAETAWNAQGRIQGQSDVRLCAAGRASLRGRTLPAACGGMRVVTSPLARCVETASLLGLADAWREPRLMEMHWGEWQGELLADLRKRHGALMQENEGRGWDFMPPGGESPRLLAARVNSWLRELSAPTLAVTHRGVIRVVLAQACGWDLRGKPPVKLERDAVQLFEVHGGLPRVRELNVR